jgi:hypothetical protein
VLEAQVNLHNWDESKRRERVFVTLTVGGIDHACRVRSVLRCPGGEPGGWVWLVESEAVPPEFPFDEREPVTTPKEGVRVRTYRGRW